MNYSDLKTRTKSFALRIMKLIDHLPKTVQGRVIANQLMKSATSTAANYRAACRARSNAEFIAKLGIVLEEADESGFWLELITDGKLLPTPQLNGLVKEIDELKAIIFTTMRSAQRSKASKPRI